MSVKMIISIVFLLTGICATVSSESSAKNDEIPEDKLLFPNLPNGAPWSDNNVCKENSQVYIDNLTNLTLWAHQILDATAKSSSNVLTGSIFQFGGFDECLQVQAPFKTQYCLATIRMKDIPDTYKPKDQYSLKFKQSDSVLKRVYRTEDNSKQVRDEIHFGWCVPASCTPSDLENSLQHHLADVEHPFQEINISYYGKVSPQLCQTESDQNNYGAVDILFCLLSALLILMAITCSIFHNKNKRRINECPKQKTQPDYNKIQIIWKAFSIPENFADLSRSETGRPELSIFYGIRTFCIMMIIMDHRFGTYLSGPLNNFDFVEKEYRRISSWFIFHGDLFVDTFFILSGMLVSYGLSSQLEKRKINPGFLIFARYVRLTPLFAFVGFFYASMFNHIGTGPLWKLIVTPETVDCRSNWWVNILYLNNYVDEDHMCMVHSWYLACDFHYFIIGIFLILLIRRNRRLGVIIFSLLFVTSIAIPFLLTLLLKRPALVRFYPLTLVAPKVDVDFQLTYIKSHTRATAYLIGMWLGLVYYGKKEMEGYRMSKIRSHLMTVFSILLIFGGMSSGALFYNPYIPYSAWASALYAGLHRPAWAFGSAGLFYAASFGHAGLLRAFLSWRPWLPLSKLVYGAYLCHMVFQFRSVASVTGTRHFSYIEVVQLTFGDWMAAFSVALILYLLIEAPVRNLFRDLLLPPRIPSQTEVNTTVTNTHSINNNNNTCDSRV